MQLTRFPGITLALAASIAVIGCGKKEEPAPRLPGPAANLAPAPAPKPEVTVKIGHVAPMTGPQAHLGKDNESGAKLAIEELNAQNLEIGGAKVKFELLAEDDGADPEEGTIVARSWSMPRSMASSVTSIQVRRSRLRSCIRMPAFRRSRRRRPTRSIRSRASRPLSA